MSNKIQVRWRGDMRFETIGPDGRVKIDAAEEFGGQGKGVRPKALMLRALGGCTALDVVALLKKMRVEVSEFRVEVLYNLTDEHPKVYDQVHVIYRFFAPEFNIVKIQKAVKLSVERYCGVYEMFRQFADVSHEIIYKEIVVRTRRKKE